MGAIFDRRASKAPFQRMTAEEREQATEHGGTQDGSNPLSDARRPMSAAEMRREIYRQHPDRATEATAAEERARQSRARGFGTQIRR